MVHPFQILLALALASPEALVEQLRQNGATAIHLDRIQLDGDAPLEAVVRYVQGETGAHAVVLDEQSGMWREAAHFNSWWNFTPADAERLIEFRATVDPKVTDLIVRTRSGGTEDSRTTLEIFRLRSGAMVNVLSLKEQETAMEHPSGDVFTTSTTLEFGPGRLMANSTRNPGNQRTATLYVWDEKRFRFEPRAAR